MLEESRKRGWRLMLIGAVLAIASTFYIIQTYNEALAQQPPERSLIAVLYSNRTIPSNTTINAAIQNETALESPTENTKVCPDEEQPSLQIGAFQLCLVDAQFVAPKTIRFPTITLPKDLEKPETMHDVKQSLLSMFGEQFNIVPLDSGDPIDQKLLQAATIPIHMRAVSIAVNQVTSVNNTVQAGDRVDVIVSYSDNEEQPITSFLLQNVLVWQRVDAPFDQNLETNFPGQSETTSNSSVTLLLSPEDALALTHMDNFAKEVRLILRDKSDVEVTQVAPLEAIRSK